MDPKEPIVTAYTSQEYVKCLQLLETAPAEIKSMTDMKILQASCLININGRSGEAHQILDKILESEPSNGLAFYGKGLAFLKEGNLEKSFENFNKSSELDTTGVISKAQVMKLKTEKLLKSQRKSNRLSGKQKKKENSEIICEICNKTFAQIFSLNRHKLIHSGERPHKCAICSFGFVQKSDLQRHMSVHNDTANFNCNSCEKKFKSKKNLSIHSLTHSVEKPFKCEICGKDFKYRRLMKLHQIVHSKRRKYNCDFCEKIFVTKPSLKAHLMMHINRKNRESLEVGQVEKVFKAVIRKYTKKNSGLSGNGSKGRGSAVSNLDLSVQNSVMTNSMNEAAKEASEDNKLSNSRLWIDMPLDTSSNGNSLAPNQGINGLTIQKVDQINIPSNLTNPPAVSARSAENQLYQPSTTPILSLPNIELPKTLQIRPISNVGQASCRIEPSGSSVASTSKPKALSSRQSVNRRESTIPRSRSSPKEPKTIIVPFMTMQQPFNSASTSLSTLLTNPQLSVAIKNSTSSEASSKWSVTMNSESKIEETAADIKKEPMDTDSDDCDRATNATDNSSNHDSLLSGENDNKYEWNLFFKSLMGDLTKMDDRQKRKFKQKTFMLIDDILQ